MSSVFLLIPFLLLGVTSAAAVTYTKGSDGSAAHQFKNPYKVSVKADPGLIVWKIFYLEPRTYSFPITAYAAAGWKIISAKYESNSGQDVTLQPPANAASYWQFSRSEDLTGAITNSWGLTHFHVVTVRFATLRQTPGGVPDYQEDIVIDSIVVPSLAILDTDGNGLGDAWEIQYFGALRNSSSADPDHDGLTNLQEYQQGSNPNDYFKQGLVTITPRVFLYQGGGSYTVYGQYSLEPVVFKIVNAATGAPLVNAPVSVAVSGQGALAITSRGSTSTKPVTVRSDSQGLVKAFFKAPNR